MASWIEYTSGDFIGGIEFIADAEPNITPSTGRKRRCAIFKCPRCNAQFRQEIAPIKNKTVKSCGCLKKSGEARIKHGHTGTRLHKIWGLMKQRCYNKNNTNYGLYGGKGISVCAEWLHSFIAFKEWALSNGYSKDLTLDRIQGHLNYCPDNCRWANQKTQICNRGLNKNNTSGFKGVVFDKRSQKYIAQITVDYANIHLGSFTTAKQAANAYDDYVMRNHLEHKLNRSI